MLLTYFGRVRFRGGIPGGLVAVARRHGARVGHRHRARRRDADRVRLAPPGCPCSAISSRGLGGGHLADLPVGDRADGPLQRRRLAAEHRERRGGRRRYPTRAVAARSTASARSRPPASARCFPTTIYIGHPGWKAMGARAGYSILNGVVRDARLPDRHARPHRVGGADRGRHGHRAVDRHRHHRAGLPGDAACARARGRRRPAAGRRRLGRPHGEDGPARRGRSAPGWAALLGGARSPAFQPVDTLDPRRLRARAGLHLHRDDARGDDRRHHRAPLRQRGALVRGGRRAVGVGPDARLPLDAGRHRVALVPAWEWAIGYAIMAGVLAVAPWTTVAGDGH